MTTYLGKRCSFCLPRVPFVNCRQFMYLVISLFGFEGRIWDLIVSVPDHCLSFYFGKMSRKYKRYYDQKAGNRKLKVSDKALILLPTKTNKLLMGWKGPYEVVEKLSPLDYRIKVGRKVKTFHINMLKQYIEREEDEQSDQLNDTSQVCAISVIVMASEESNDEVIEGLIETLSHGNTQDNSQVNVNQNVST